MGTFDTGRVDRAEIYRYLGAAGGCVDSRTEELVEDVLLELGSRADPRHIMRVFPLRIIEAPGAPVIDFGCFSVRSGSLYRNLLGCDEVILFAATIGEGADFLIRRYGKTQMSRAAVCQAASAAMIEAYCDELNEKWKEEYAASGRRLRPRFSCGYGDFSLEHQREFLRVLEMDKRLGIRLNDALLMYPTKSVTAVIGIESP